MLLRELHVSDFRPFRDATITFPANGLVLLVGANNTGKSALLSALDVVAGRSGGERARRVGATQPSRVQATFDLADEERRDLFVGSPRAAQWLESDAFRTVKWSFRDYRNERMFVNRLEAADGRGQFAEIGVIRDFDETAGTGQLWVLDIGSWLNTRDPSEAFVLSPSATGGVLDYLSSGGYLAMFQERINDWRGRFYHFYALRVGTDRTRPLQAVPMLEPTGTNLAEALLYLNTQDDPAWREIGSVMTDILPDAGDLRTPAEGGSVQVAFLDPYLSTRQNLKDLGTGVEQLLMTAYAGVRVASGGVIAIEEPETNLHPGSQRDLLKYLRSWSSERLFVVSTHSTVFLD